MVDKKTFSNVELRTLWVASSRKMPCLELIILRPELSNKLLVPHAFAYRVIVCFVKEVLHLRRNERH